MSSSTGITLPACTVADASLSHRTDGVKGASLPATRTPYSASAMIRFSPTTTASSARPATYEARGLGDAMSARSKVCTPLRPSLTMSSRPAMRSRRTSPVVAMVARNAGCEGVDRSYTRTWDWSPTANTPARSTSAFAAPGMVAMAAGVLDGLSATTVVSVLVPTTATSSSAASDSAPLESVTAPESIRSAVSDAAPTCNWPPDTTHSHRDVDAKRSTLARV